MSYAAPSGFSSSITNIFGQQYRIPFYPYLQAYSNSSGQWALVWPVNIDGYNNLMTCTATRGCGIVNQGPAQEFLGSVAIGSDGGYWFSYYLAPTPGNGSLRQQMIYFPNASSLNPVIGADTVTGIDSNAWQSWAAGTAPCPGTLNCRVAGDYSRLDSFGPSLIGASPYLQSGGFLYTTFAQDPPGDSNVTNFKPNFVAVPRGSDVSAKGSRHPQWDSIMELCPPHFLTLSETDVSKAMKSSDVK